MLAITTSNPFHRMISHVLTTPKQLFLSKCIKKLERVSSYGSLTFSSLASILHIATVVFAIVAVSTGPMFVAVVLTGTALAGTGIILAITAVVLRRTNLFKGKISLNNHKRKNSNGIRPFNGSSSQQNQSPVPSLQLTSATIPSDHETKRKKSPRLDQLSEASVNQLVRELEKKDLKIDELKKEMKIVKKERKEAQDECTRLRSDITQIENRIKIIRQLHSEASTEKRELERKVKKLEEELAKREEELAKGEMETGWTTLLGSSEKTNPSSSQNSGKDTKS